LRREDEIVLHGPIEGDIAAAMEAGMAAMKRTLDRLAA
jgi:hypothetical protein